MTVCCFPSGMQAPRLQYPIQKMGLQQQQQQHCSARIPFASGCDSVLLVMPVCVDFFKFQLSPVTCTLSAIAIHRRHFSACDSRFFLPFQLQFLDFLSITALLWFELSLAGIIILTVALQWHINFGFYFCRVDF
eukprot:scpid40374/ scgid21539/ 